MKAQQLKNAILQLAIQGKLIPQNAADEPASALLAQIRKEKEQLVKAGKLKKKDLATTPIADEEKPFEIPESWEWVRLSTIVSILGDGIHGTPQYDSEGEYYFVNGNNLNNGKIVIKPETKRCNVKEFEKYKKPLNDHSMLVSINGTIGNYAFYNEEPVFLGKSACFFNLIMVEFKDYMKYFIQSKYFLDYALESATGSTIKNVSLKAMNNLIIPLPPLAEQHRIVSKIEELMPLVEEFGAAQEKLNRLNETLPEALKKSILQQAIQGKLVPQNATDEPASALLSRIRKEKEQLVKAGKLKKKDLETTPITDEEKPFEIPESWEWVNIPMIGNSQLGKTKNPNQRAGKMFPYLCSINVYWEGIRMDTLKEMLFTESEQEKYRIEKGDLVVCEGGDCGRTSIWEKEETVLYQNALHRVRFYQGINPYYIRYCMFLYCNNGLINAYKKGETIQHLVKNKLDAIPFPLPPLAEQHRIVAKIEELMAMVDGMK